MRAAVLLSILMALVLPASAAPPWLVGDWFGQGEPNDKSEMWLVHMGADGSFHALFRACSKGKARDNVGTGTWSMVGDLETIQFQLWNGQFAPREDLYQVLSHDGKSQTYKFLANGFIFHSTRVNAKFQMPACDLVS